MQPQSIDDDLNALGIDERPFLNLVNNTDLVFDLPESILNER